MNDRQTALHASSIESAMVLEGQLVNSNALQLLGEHLQAQGYHFTTVTPLTHHRVNARRANKWARSLADILGWSRPFHMSVVDAPISLELFVLMQEANILRSVPGGWKSSLRASTLDDKLYFHSAYPTDAPDAIFFGPDTYRFVRALKQELTTHASTIRRAVDIGCGAGAGAMTIAAACPQAEVFAVDINDMALRLAAVNAQLAGLANVTPCNSNLLSGLSGEFDLIISNPPYLVDREQRTYRHGGGALGADLSLAIVDAALDRLAPGGTLLLYTGAAMMNGADPLLDVLQQKLLTRNCTWSYDEIDPDVFGEELDETAYNECDRIAAVWLKVKMSDIA